MRTYLGDMTVQSTTRDQETTTIDKIFLDFYVDCQMRYHDIDARLMSLDAATHQKPLGEAVSELRKLVEFTHEPDIDAEVPRTEVRELRLRFTEAYGTIGLFYLLRAADSLLNEFRSVLQRRASTELSLFRWTPVIVPKPLSNLARPTRADARGRGCESRRISDRLDNFCVVQPSEIPVNYVPIGHDGLPQHATSQAPLLRALDEGVKIPRIVCANFPEGAPPFEPERLPADGGWKDNGYRSTFLFRQRPGLEDARRELEALLQTSMNEQAHVLVLPELTVPEELLDVIRAHMQSNVYPMLVVAGSWHREAEARKETINSCPILGVGGKELGRFCKTYRFEITDGEIAELRPLLGDALCSHPGPATERIRLGSHGLVIDAGSMRFGIAICIDALKVPSLIDAYTQLGVNCLLVPALSFRSDRFTANAKNFAEMTNGIVAFSNPPCVLPDPANPKLRQLGSRITLGFGRANSLIAGQTAERTSRTMRPYEHVHAVLEPKDLPSVENPWQN